MLWFQMVSQGTANTLLRAIFRHLLLQEAGFLQGAPKMQDKCKSHLLQRRACDEDGAGDEVAGDDVVHVVRVVACEARHACRAKRSGYICNSAHGALCMQPYLQAPQANSPVDLWAVDKDMAPSHHAWSYRDMHDCGCGRTCGERQGGGGDARGVAEVAGQGELAIAPMMVGRTMETGKASQCRLSTSSSHMCLVSV